MVFIRETYTTDARALPSRPLAGRVGRRRASDGGRGGGTTLAPYLSWKNFAGPELVAPPPTPDPSPPRAEPVLGLAEGKTRGRAGGGESALLLLSRRGRRWRRRRRAAIQH